MRGLGAVDWDSIIGRGFDFGNSFLEAWRDRGVAERGFAPGFNPYATSGGYFAPTGQAGQTPYDPSAPPGSRASGALSDAWSQLAATIGVQPGTLSLLAVGAVALAFMKPPGRR